MRRVTWTTILFLTLLLPAGLPGCGGPPTDSLGGVRATHEGTLLPLPDRAGYVEILCEPADANTQTPKANGKGKVIAYFLGPDGTSPPARMPTDVKFTDEARKTHELAPVPGASRYESGPVAVPLGEVSGRLDATLDGSAVRLVIQPR